MHWWLLHPSLKGATGVTPWWCPVCNQCVDSMDDLHRLQDCRDDDMRMLIIFWTVVMLGCSTATHVAPTYITLKLIERGTVTAEEVVEKVDRFETYLIDGVTLTFLAERVREELGYNSLSMADRYLVDTLLMDVADRIDVGIDVPLSEGHKAIIMNVLGTIRVYAVMQHD